MSVIISIWCSNMKKFFRNKMESIGSLIQPMLWLLIFSVGMSSFMTDKMPVDYLSFVLPGMIGFTLVTACINGGTSWVSDRLDGIVKTYQVAPIPRLVPLIANILTVFSKALLQGLVIVIVGLVLGSQIQVSLLGAILSLILVGLFVTAFAGVALYFASISPNSGAYHMVIFMFQMPLLFFSNALYGLKNLPIILKIIAYINPMTHLISGLRSNLVDSSEFVPAAYLIQFSVLLIYAIYGLYISKKAYEKIIWQD